MRACYEDYREVVRLTTQLAAAGDLAWELGTNRTVVAGGQGGFVDMGKYLAVWRKIDGEWLIVAVAATSDAPYMVPVEP